MLKRFLRIKHEFGTMAFLRVLLLAVGLILMFALDVFHFPGSWSVVIILFGLVIGFLLRKKIPSGYEYYPRAIFIGGIVYSIVLFAGDRLGVENYLKLAIISLTTIIVFNLNFWTLSDESIMNEEKAGVTKDH